jgi:hypothetical protein
MDTTEEKVIKEAMQALRQNLRGEKIPDNMLINSYFSAGILIGFFSSDNQVIASVILSEKGWKVSKEN